jgi:hypothetical protein
VEIQVQMNFADEEYVRLYITDTNTWRMLGWDGQAVLALMLRRFDRYTGVFEFGRHDPERAIISAIGCPPETARIGLAAILAEDVWVKLETSFYWPTCVEAQTCKRSDKYRKRQQREREAHDEMSRNVTSESDTGHATVTTCHVDVTEVTASRQCDQMSRDVTLGKARQGKARPSSDLEDPSKLTRNAPLRLVAPEVAKVKQSRKVQTKSKISPDWQPTEAKLAALSAKTEIPVGVLRRYVPEFRIYWLPGGKGHERKDAAKRDCDWDSTFGNWIDSQVSYGKIVLTESNPGSNGRAIVSAKDIGLP